MRDAIFYIGIIAMIIGAAIFANSNGFRRAQLSDVQAVQDDIKEIRDDLLRIMDRLDLPPKPTPPTE